MEREGGRFVHPAPSMRAKEVEGVQLEWGAAWAEGTAARKREGGGVEHCPSCAPGMRAKGRARRAGQGGAGVGWSRGRAGQGWGGGLRTSRRRVHTTPFASPDVQKG